MRIAAAWKDHVARHSRTAQAAQTGQPVGSRAPRGPQLVLRLAGLLAGLTRLHHHARNPQTVRVHGRGHPEFLLQGPVQKPGG
jgi:hypothetical protein